MRFEKVFHVLRKYILIASHYVKSAFHSIRNLMLAGKMMSEKIEDVGFLSKDIEKWKIQIRGNHKEIFSLCERLNKHSQKMMFSLEIHKLSLTELLSCSCLVRTLSNFQGIIILSEIGMANEAKIVLRSLVETMFVMVAIKNDPKFAQAITEQDIYQRLNAYKAIKRNIERGTITDATPTITEVESLIEKFKQEIKNNRIKLLNKRDFASKAGMEDYYDTIYNVLCSSVHANPRDLEKYLAIDKKGHVQEILWGPDVNDLEDILFASIEVMVNVTNCVEQIFDVSVDKTERDSIISHYKKLGEIAIT